MNINFWGVRGSIPSTSMTQMWADHYRNLMHEFFKSGFSTSDHIEAFIQGKSISSLGGFGTGTTCVEVASEGKSIIIDCGSGIKNLNDQLVKSGKFKTQNEFHIFMSHFHFDHILGIPFFTPHFLKGKTIHYYAVQKEVESVVRSMFSKPMFPVAYENLQANIQFHHIRPYEKQRVQGMDITAYKLDHPDPCYGFRVDSRGKSYAHAIDHESVRLSIQDLGLDGGLFKNADLLYFDAQYTEDEMKGKEGWGHGTADRGFQVAANFNIQQILFAHHDPSSSIQDLHEHKEKAEVTIHKRFPQLFKNPDFKWDYAYEGQSITI